MGLLWYFFIELFDWLHVWYGVIMMTLPYIFVLPLTLRFHRYPIELAAILYFSWIILKPVSSLHDLVFNISLLLLSPRTLSRFSNITLIFLCSLPISICLYTVDNWLWLVTGTGNANYIYFQCLAYNAFLASIIIDFMFCTMKRDKALRITEKLLRNHPKNNI